MVEVLNIKDPERYEVISKLLYLFENGRGARTAGTTLWSAYNAVNDYLNYLFPVQEPEQPL